MANSRTRERALDELRRLLPDIAADVDERYAALLSDALLVEVFDITWTHQFDDDHSDAARLLRQVVRESIEGVTEEKNATKVRRTK